MHVQSSEQSNLGLLHWHVVPWRLKEYLINSLHATETSGIGIQTATHDCDH